MTSANPAVSPPPTREVLTKPHWSLFVLLLAFLAYCCFDGVAVDKRWEFVGKALLLLAAVSATPDILQLSNAEKLLNGLRWDHPSGQFKSVSWVIVVLLILGIASALLRMGQDWVLWVALLFFGVALILLLVLGLAWFLGTLKMVEDDQDIGVSRIVFSPGLAVVLFISGTCIDMGLLFK